MLFLKSLSLRGFKSIRELSNLQFGPLNVLIGANGAGKSNLVDFFRFLNFMMTRAMQEFVGRSGGASSLLFCGPKITPEFSASLDAETEKGLNRYAFRCAYAPEDSLIFTEERILFQGHNSPHSPYERLFGGGHRETALKEAGALSDPTPAFFVGALSRLRVYHFHDTSAESRLRGSCEAEDSRFLYSEGGNLAAMLYRLREGHRNHYDRIVTTVRLVAPFFDDFVLEPTGTHRRLSLRWRSKGGEYEFGAHQLSDGTLRFVALATLLGQPLSWLPALLVIDEPELGLHPVALGALAGLLQATSSHTQVLVSTQSADLVDCFEPGDIIVADRRDGASFFRRLDSSALEEWLDEYTLGDLWRRNVLRGGPAHE